MTRPWRRTTARPAPDAAAQPRTAVELVEVSHAYGERPVLRDV